MSDTVYELEVCLTKNSWSDGKLIKSEKHEKTKIYTDEKECLSVKDSMVKESRDHGYLVCDYHFTANCYNDNGSFLTINIYKR